MAKYLVKAGFELAGSKERKENLEEELRKTLFDYDDKFFVVYDNAISAMEILLISI
jgi:hypothetical protein